MIKNIQHLLLSFNSTEVLDIIYFTRILFIAHLFSCLRVTACLSL